MPAQSEAEWTIVARVVTTHGRRGELDAELWTDFPERFETGCRLWLTVGGALQSFELEERRFHKGRILLKLRGLDNLSEAEHWCGSLVQVPRSERWEPPPGTVYLSDLIGCVVYEGQQCLGTVSGWNQTSAVPLLCVQSAKGEILIPFAEDICQPPNLSKKEIHVRLPEGLAELNQEAASPPRRSGNRKK